MGARSQGGGRLSTAGQRVRESCSSKLELTLPELVTATRPRGVLQQ